VSTTKPTSNFCPKELLKTLLGDVIMSNIPKNNLTNMGGGATAMLLDVFKCLAK
jgi:hypothetical protein